MEKKWYNYFLSVDKPEEGSPEEQTPAPAGTAPRASPGAPPPRAPGAPPRTSRSAAQTVAEIAAGIAAEPKFTAPVANPTSFDEIYRAAEIPNPTHGYTILKVADMLQSEHIRDLPAKVKRGSVLVALDAAGVKIEEVIKDAVSRDRALDTYERVQLKALEEMETRKTRENGQIQAEIDRLVAEQQAKIKANNEAVTKEKQRLAAWRAQKQQEEEKIAGAVSPFVLENPITTGGAAAEPPRSPSPKAQGS